MTGCSVNVMDFCKTFESVVHNIQITESMLRNINKEHVKWIKNWPNDSSQNCSRQWSMVNAELLLSSCVLVAGGYHKDQCWASIVQHFQCWESVIEK